MSRELKWEGKPLATPGEPEEGRVYTSLNSSGCIALGMVFLWIENVIFYAIYSDPSSLLLSFSPPYWLNYMPSLSRFRKQRGEWSKQTNMIKKKKKAQETHLQTETHTHKIHKNTKLETIIYKQRPLRQNCPLTGNNHTILLPARMRLWLSLVSEWD